MANVASAPSPSKETPTCFETTTGTFLSCTKYCAGFSFRSAIRVAGVFIGSNLAAGFCLLHAPQIIYALNYQLAAGFFGCSGFFATSTSLISLGFTYEWVNLVARAVGGAIGYGAADTLIDGSLFLLRHLCHQVQKIFTACVQKTSN